MADWFTSDSHFGHANIIKYDVNTRNHFKSIEEHDEYIVQEWNKAVKPGDKVYHLGDFSFTKPEDIDKYWKRLNGRIQLVIGNHDNKGTGLNMDFGYYIPQHVIWLKKEKLFLSHYPHFSWPSSHHGVVHLFGHVHEAFLTVPGCKAPNLNVSCNWHNFRPLSLEEAREKALSLSNWEERK